MSHEEQADLDRLDNRLTMALERAEKAEQELVQRMAERDGFDTEARSLRFALFEIEEAAKDLPAIRDMAREARLSIKHFAGSVKGVTRPAADHGAALGNNG